MSEELGSSGGPGGLQDPQPSPESKGDALPAINNCNISVHPAGAGHRETRHPPPPKAKHLSSARGSLPSQGSGRGPVPSQRLRPRSEPAEGSSGSRLPPPLTGLPAAIAAPSPNPPAAAAPPHKAPPLPARGPPLPPGRVPRGHGGRGTSGWEN